MRVEQISPFPFDQIANYATQYKNAKVAWAQEEPKNQGAWRVGGAEAPRARGGTTGTLRRASDAGTSCATAS